MRLVAKFVSREVISFAVGGGGGGMGVCRKIVEFGGAVVATLGHPDSPRIVLADQKNKNKILSQTRAGGS
jgi:hypothetical protein